MIRTNNKKGFTLIEMLTAVSIFSVTMLLVVSVFQAVVEGQRSAIASQNTQASLSYAFEVMSKEIRNAQERTANDCDAFLFPAASNKIYNADLSNNILYLKNKKNECVFYQISNNRLEIERNGQKLYVTPDEVIINDINFIVFDNLAGSVNDKQAKVTFSLSAHAATVKSSGQHPLNIQTTISSRFYQ